MTSWWNSRRVQKLKRKRGFLVGVGIIGCFVLIGIFSAQLASPQGYCLLELGGIKAGSVYNPASSLFWRAFNAPASCYQTPRLNFSQLPTPPSREAILGTSGGYDVWYGMVWGTRTAFKIGLLVIVSSGLIGVLLGAISGYVGGWTDEIIMRVTDVMMAFPSLVLIIVIVSLVGRNLMTIALAFALTNWSGYTRLVRSEVLKTKTLEYVESARALGAGSWGVLVRHVLPNSLENLIQVTMLDMGNVVLLLSGLSILGLGAEVGYGDWGQFVNLARVWVSKPKYWYVMLIPGVLIMLWGVGWNLMGSGSSTSK